eukprot:3565197-Pleurochrysis_carterae.AAC.1
MQHIREAEAQAHFGSIFRDQSVVGQRAKSHPASEDELYDEDKILQHLQRRRWRTFAVGENDSRWIVVLTRVPFVSDLTCVAATSSMRWLLYTGQMKRLDLTVAGVRARLASVRLPTRAALKPLAHFGYSWL